MKQRALTEHMVRCPLEHRTACLTVRSDPDASPSRRHRDVTACSLRPPASVVLPARREYFADIAPPLPYLREPDRAPRPSSDVACAKPCLAILNAAEAHVVAPLRCTSGVSDSLELARQTQSPAIMRLLWFYSA